MADEKKPQDLNPQTLAVQLVAGLLGEGQEHSYHHTFAESLRTGPEKLSAQPLRDILGLGDRDNPISKEDFEKKIQAWQKDPVARNNLISQISRQLKTYDTQTVGEFGRELGQAQSAEQNAIKALHARQAAPAVPAPSTATAASAAGSAPTEPTGLNEALSHNSFSDRFTRAGKPSLMDPPVDPRVVKGLQNLADGLTATNADVREDRVAIAQTKADVDKLKNPEMMAVSTLLGQVAADRVEASLERHRKGLIFSGDVYGELKKDIHEQAEYEKHHGQKDGPFVKLEKAMDGLHKGLEEGDKQLKKDIKAVEKLDRKTFAADQPTKKSYVDANGVTIFIDQKKLDKLKPEDQAAINKMVNDSKAMDELRARTADTIGGLINDHPKLTEVVNALPEVENGRLLKGSPVISESQIKSVPSFKGGAPAVEATLGTQIQFNSHATVQQARATEVVNNRNDTLPQYNPAAVAPAASPAPSGP